MTGVLSGPLFDLGWFRVMLIAGNALIVLGLFMLSISRNYAAVFLSQGICIGLGIGLLYVPSIALLGLSFKRRLSVVHGIVTSGNTVGKSTTLCLQSPIDLDSGLGGIAYVIAFDRLSESRGFGWAVRVQGLISIGMSVAAIPALLTGTSALAKARTARNIWDRAAFSDPLFLVFTASLFAGNLGYITPYFFIPSFAQDCLGTSQKMAMYILVFSIAESCLGRLGVGVVAHFVDPLVAWGSCAALAGMLCFVWMAVASQRAMIAWGIFWGFCSAGLVTLPSAAFPGLCPDQRRLGSRSGMSFGIASFSALLGPPIAGALIRHTRGLTEGSRPRSDYLGSQVWAGCCLLFDAGLLFVLWRMATKRIKTGLLA
jgi:MFS family permease